MTSARSYSRLGIVVLGLSAYAGGSPGCGGSPEGHIHHGELIQFCEEDEHCPAQVGARCESRLCVCPNDGDAICSGGPEPEAWICRPRRECIAPEEPSSSGDAGGPGGAGGSGGDGGDAPVSECAQASDCPQPADGRCGFATCEEGRCDLVVKVGPTESQKRGDCKTTLCFSDGHSEEMIDPGDIYNDGKQCTMDICNGGEPKNELYPDGWTCPEAGAGVCNQGECVECIFAWPYNQCDFGLGCDEVYCVPMACVQQNMCGGSCRPCPAMGPCSVNEDCLEGVCDIGGQCAIPTCLDGVQNDGETGKDCGAMSCPNKCLDGEGCALPDNCISGVCWGGQCQAPTCTDGVRNGDETGTDCGGGCVLPCKT